ncbi:MAG: DUF2634 domain-containing protein [Fusobacteriaceae bacterium]
MSFDVFLNGNEKIELLGDNLELFREYAIDFTTGEPLLKDGEIIALAGNDALKVWIWKALKTERFKYLAYSDSYGNELHDELGTVYSVTLKNQIVFSEIEECLKVNPYITRVHTFSTEWDGEGTLKTIFAVDTIYGSIEMREGVNVY